MTFGPKEGPAGSDPDRHHSSILSYKYTPTHIEIKTTNVIHRVSVNCSKNHISMTSLTDMFFATP